LEGGEILDDDLVTEEMVLVMVGVGDKEEEEEGEEKAEDEAEVDGAKVSDWVSGLEAVSERGRFILTLRSGK
jgi:hypothetical protein